MPKGVARQQGSSGELISHFSAVRLRVVGNGILRLTMYSLQDVESSTLPTITMATSTNRQPAVLANFIQQRASLEIKTTDINEWFRINRVIVFTKPLWADYPR